MSDGRPDMVRKMEIIRVVHLTIGDSIELIWSPFEFLPFWVDLVNCSSKDGFFEPTGTGSPLRGRPVMKFISLPVIAIDWLSQIFPSWYLLMRNLASSSLRFPKLSMMGALREDLILVAVRFRVHSLFPHSLSLAQCLGQLCSSRLAFLILFSHF